MCYFYLNRQWACANSCAVVGWSECFRILGYSEKGRWCGFYVPLIILAASQNGHSISRSQYTLQEGMVLVVDVLILVLSWDGQSILGVMPMCCTTQHILYLKRISKLFDGITGLPYVLQAYVHGFGCTTSKQVL